MQVLRSLAMRPLAGVRLCVVLDRPEAVYSGMVPGFVAGDYRAEELEIDVVPLARRARARVLLAPALRILPGERRIELEGRPPLSYDVASLDLGSGVRGAELPGVRDHALATRPIRGFVDALDARLARAGEEGRPLRLVIVGGGAAGLELAFTLGWRCAGRGRPVEIAVVCASDDVLPGYPRRVAARARREALARGVRLRCGTRVTGVEKDALRIEGGGREPCDLAVWAAGAAAPAPIADSPLPRDAQGFVRVGPTLQVVGHDELFAAGDCAALEHAPWVRKAGVYAVRAGPPLERNLRAFVEGRPLRAYRPQRDFLSLLHLGDRRALCAKWGAVAVGRSVWRAKDRIDRRFVRRFRVLDADGAPARRFPSPGSMGLEPMECGGCAAKLGAAPLAAALSRLEPAPRDAGVRIGLAAPDDAAALSAPGGGVWLATLDGFRAFCDDPWMLGRVAAVNAVSDVYAMGGRPRYALALVTLPDREPGRQQEELVQVLAGVRAALDPLGVALVGGHSTTGAELFVGLSVGGEAGAGEPLLTLGGLEPGQRLILTKPLGTGVVLAADMRGLARGAWLQAALACMVRPNAAALAAARGAGATGCTDVSGFGLAGHLSLMLRASGCSARLSAGALPALPGALELLARGERSSFHEQNAAGRRGVAADAELRREAAFELLFDPQTSGGLLFGVSAARCQEALDALHRSGDAAAAAIGAVGRPREDGVPIELCRGL